MMGKTRKIVISLLLAAAAVCLSVAFVACGGKGKDSGGYGAGEEGIYYYDKDSSTEYLMTLQSGVYLISLDGVSGYSGTYSYDEGTKTVSFVSSEGESFDAVFSDDVMRLSVSGTGYTFLRHVYYTVTFVDGDGVEMAESRVVNGKSAEPYEAEDTEDSYFIGWYADPSYSEEYGFDTAVTCDTTVYGWFLEKDPLVRDFVVTYDYGDGVTEKETTKNGAVQRLPSVDNLLGWWVSDTNSGDELTYMYAGETLREDTTLFAVYDTGAELGASVYGDGITWTASVASIIVRIEGVGVSETLTGVGGSIRYDFSSLDAGVYTVTLSSGALSETRVYVNRGLARVSGMSVVNGKIFFFSAVEDAEGYIIEVTDGTKVYSEDLGGRTYYDFSDWEMTESGITFTVTAYAGGFVESVSDPFTYLLTLGNVTLTLVGDTVSWNAAEGALEYRVTVTADGEEETFTTVKTEVSLKSYAKGTVISVSVEPVTPGYWSEAAYLPVFTKTTLAAPVITDVRDGVIYWETSDPAATGYDININGSIITVNGGSVGFYLTSEADLAPGADGTYTVMIKALGNGESSEYGDSVVMTVDEMGSNLSYSDGVVTWQYALSAAKFVVQVNDGDEIEVISGNSCEVVFDKSGDNEIKVYFVDAEGERSGAASLTVFAYAVILDAREYGTSADVVYLASGDTYRLPDAESVAEGYSFDGWYTLPDYDEDGVSYGGKGRKVENGTTFTGGSTAVLYAYYSPNAYTVTLIYAEGDKTVWAYGTVYYMRSFEMPVPAAEGNYEGETFYGWFDEYGDRYTDANGRGSFVYSLAGDMTLIGKWTESLKYTPTELGTERGYAVSKGPDIGLSSEVTVPETYDGLPVIALMTGAFSGCTGLEVLNIPDTVGYVAMSGNGYSSGSGAFDGCSSLREVNVYATGEPDSFKEVTYYSEDGVLFYYDSDTDEVSLVYYPYGRTDSSYTVPGKVSNESQLEAEGSDAVPKRGVDRISTLVFSSNPCLTEVTIASSVSRVEYRAFYNCEKLKKVVFEEGTGSSSLVTEAEVFRGCSSLSEVVLPSRLTDFDSSIFDGCYALATVTVAADGGEYTSRDGLLCNRIASEIVFCPVGRTSVDFTADELRGVTSVGERAFYACDKLTALYIPSNITRIGESAFEGCAGLVTLIFENNVNANALTIERRAFYGCTGLGSVTLPVNLYSLGEYAFGGCVNLTSVSVESYGDVLFSDYAFGTDDTPSVYYVEELVIGSSTGVINISGVFGNGILSIEIGADNPNYAAVEGVIYNASGTEILYFPVGVTSFVSSDGLEVIRGSVFRERSELESVVIGKSVREIEAYAFYGCTSLSSVTFAETDGVELSVGAYAFCGCSSLATIDIPSRCTEIGDYAFAYCTSLTSIDIPASVSAMGLYDDGGNLVRVYTVFVGSSALAAINVKEGNPSFSSSDGILYSADGKTLYVVPVGYATVGNDTIDLTDKNIEIVSEYAFGDSNFSEISLPNTLTRVETNAFAGSSRLAKITFAEGGTGTLTLAEGSEEKGGVFSYLSVLEEVSLPENVIEIPAYAFCGCTSLVSVFAGKSIESVGSHAFYNCPSLASLENVFDSATAIGDYAFYNCAVLEGISLSEEMEELGDGAFSCCGALESVTIPSGIDAIGENTFYNCSSLTKVEIKGDVLSIGPSAFELCAALESINIPDSVASIGEYAFCDCSALETVEFGDSLAAIGDRAFWRCESLEEVAIPDGVTSIPMYCFGGCSSLATVTIGDGVTYIGTYAFNECYALASVTFGDGLEEIDDNAFYNCTALASVTLPGSLETVGDYAFANTNTSATPHSALTTLVLGDGVREIGDYAFRNNDSLTSVTIGTGLQKMGSMAFDGCTGITGVYLDGEAALAAWTAIDFADSTANPVYYCQALYLDGGMLTELVVPQGVASIGAYSFSGYTALTSVTMSDTVTSVGNHAFYGCTNLSEVAFGSRVRTLESYAFYNCTKVGKYDLPASLTSIGNYAFYQSVAEINFAEGSKMTTLGQEAFYYYKGDSLVLPEGLETIGVNAFNGATNLVSVTVPSSLKRAESGAFNSCSALKNIYIADMAAWCRIDFAAANSNPLYYGGSLWLDGTLQTGVIVPDGVTSIGAYAFYNFSAMENVSLPATLTHIGESAFTGCSSLESVYISDMGALCEITFDGVQANPLYFADGLYLNFAKVTDVVIPEGTVSVGDYVFYGKTFVASVVIPGSVLSIGASAFYGCTGLSSVTLGDGVELIGENAFCCCTALTSVTLSDSVLSIGASAFYGCTALSEVYVGAGVEEIGGGVFGGCTSLASITVSEDNGFYAGYNGDLYDKDMTSLILIAPGRAVTDYTAPDTVVYIADSIFEGYTTLETVTLSGDVEYIGESAFEGCTSLTSVSIGANSPVKISDRAFYGCAALGSMTFGCATYIGDYSFYGCSSLTSLTVPAETTYVGSYAFNGSSKLATVDMESCEAAVGAYAFYNIAALTEAKLKGVTSVGNYAFYQTGITAAELDSCAGGIGDYAFSTCTSLVTATLGNCTAIGQQAFYGCTALTETVIPDTCATVGSSAFTNCSAMTTLTIGNGFVSAGSGAFTNTYALETIYFNAVSASDVASTNTYMFGGNAGKDGTGITVYIGKEVTRIPGGFFGCYTTNATQGPNNSAHITEVIFAEDGVCTEIGTYGFAWLQYMTFIELPEGITTIQTYAFRQSKLESIVIPSSVTFIGQQAFYFGNVGDETVSFSTVYYKGSEEDWDAISQGTMNNQIDKTCTTTTFYYYSESEPQANFEETDYDGNWWHYDEEGDVAIWDFSKDHAA